MKILFDSNTKKRIFWFNFDKMILKLLDIVPKEHLIGIEKIVIVDEIKLKKGRKAAGAYKRKNGRDSAMVELSVKSIYKGMPRILFLLPFVAKFSLADVLFHEIGHHYHHKFKHGIGNSRAEKFAEDYRRSMLKKAFWGWAIILRPISPVIKYLANIIK